MGQLMRTQLEKQKTFSRTLKMSPPGCRPVTSPLAPLLGRDLRGRLCIFPQEKMDRMTTLASPGGWDKTPSFDGQASCQRGTVPFGSPRFGPGPEQKVYGVGEVYQTARPPPTYTAKPAPPSPLPAKMRSPSPIY